MTGFGRDAVWAGRQLRRFLRGGISGFRIFLACLIAGVAAIAAVGSLSESLNQGLRADGQKLLGGDLELRLHHRPIAPEVTAWLEEKGRLSEIVTLRAMARNPEAEGGSGRQSLVELKAVDSAYPLYGTLEHAPALPRAELFREADGVWGAVADPALTLRLGLQDAERRFFRIGTATFELRADLTQEPDRVTRLVGFGPHVLISRAALEATGLLQPGAMVSYRTRLAYDPGQALDHPRAALAEAFPEGGWRVRDTRDPAPSVARFLTRLALFMSFVGLGSLLVGGLGVGNAVRGFLAGQGANIATLKCLGASRRQVLLLYLGLVMVMGGLASLIALALGAAVPLLSAGLFSELLGWNLAREIFPMPLILAGATGLLTVMVFSLPQLGQAAETKAARLFRGAVGASGPSFEADGSAGRPLQRLRQNLMKGPILASLLCLALLAFLVVASASDPFLAGLFVVGAALAFLLLAGAARLLRSLLLRRRASAGQNLAGTGGRRLRLALANMTRPGAPLASLMISLGLGLSLLVAVTQVEGNLDLQVSRSLPKEAPSFYFLDLRPDQEAAFADILAAHPGLAPAETVPMLRGRITKLKGRPVSSYEIPRHVEWVFRGDRGMTWQADPPADLELTAGSWWPADYDGPPLVSLDEEVARAMGLVPGDKLTVNLLGREIESEIANLRRIAWDDLSINFVLVFSPGLMESAPFSLLATLRAPEALQDRIESEIAAALPNVSVIRVKESLESVAALIGRIAVALRAVAWMVLFTVTLVLAGALAAESQRRGRDAIVLKVLGATRFDVMASLLIEYGILGLFSAVLAAFVGCLTAYGLLTYLMSLSFTPLPGPLLAAVASALALTLAFGLAETWINLARKAAPLLRNA